jgi:hypothetical protein
VGCVEIKLGLRKLEFEVRPKSAELPQYAVVEFVRTAPLGAGEKVRVPLGSQEGVLRELVGEPQLLEKIKLGLDGYEYRYRVRGPIGSMQSKPDEMTWWP